MAHNVETMFSAGREKPWHYEETKEHTKLVQEALNSVDALRAAGLDWLVESRPITTSIEKENEDGSLIEDIIHVPNYVANVRSSDNAILGVVSDRYQIVQNTDAFDFTDNIVGETENGVVRYETAGSLNGGKQIWLLAKMPPKMILDDEIEPYMFFTNNHDGKGAIRVGLTPIRVVCNNTLNMAISSARRSWSTKHMGDMKAKREEAKAALFNSDKYMAGLDEEADKLANMILRKEQVDEILDEIFPVSDNDSERTKRNIQETKDGFQICYMMPDITKFGESPWRAINAMSDYVTHVESKRKTPTYEEKRWGRIMDGHPIFDRFVELAKKKAYVR